MKNPSKRCSNPLKSFDNYVKDELEKILSSLEHLLSQKDWLGLVPAGRSNHSDVPRAKRFRATPVAAESGFFGREDIKETIIQSLRSPDVCDENIAVIPIIGAGGIGKTTLAQIIYNDPGVKQQFGEVRAWVTVSTEFDLLTITKKIIGKVSTSQINGSEDEQELLFKLRDALDGKKFLLVLDDVWSEDLDEWDNLKSCFESGERGSKIIVTTRSTRVASIAAPSQRHHLLPELPEEDCRRLFAKTVFTGDRDRDARPELQEIGKKIVEKCKGLPLSVKSVGGILRRERDPEKWESILKSSVWELLQQNSKNIIPSLWLSYRYLPSEIKPCFAYCSIFPKDYRFQKKEVVRLWMAEGFLKNEAGKRGITMEEVGKRYFEELISRSLFQTYYGVNIMHDLVHDLAMYASGKFCFWLDEDKMLHDLACETRHLSYNLAIGDAKKFEGLSKAKRLHTFVGFELSRQSQELDILKVLEEFSVEGACLRVLSLSSSYKIDSLLASVGKLKHLRYLNLSTTSVTKLPDSIGTLYNLQTLLLSSCRNLTRLPSNLGSLINLHHLDTSGSPLEGMPPKMCNLKKLHTLTDFVVGKQSGSSIKDLGVLEDLHGMINVSGLQNVNNVDDALKADLKNKKNLSELVLKWDDQSDERDSRQEEKVLGALQPHASLKKLIIFEYGGTGFPDWLGDSLFSKIERMYLIGCRDCRFLPSLGRLASLKELKMGGFHKLETIDDGFYGNNSPFKSLEVLHFSDMPEWKRWSFIEVPRLKKLMLRHCPKLVEGLPNSNTVANLGIYGCESLDFPKNQLYPSLESLNIVRSCCSIKRLSLEHLPKLNELQLEELESLIELTGELTNELKRLFINKCPKLEFMANGCYGSLEDLRIEKCEALKSIPLEYFPKLNCFTLEELECLVELTGESRDEFKRLSIVKCPKLEFLGNGHFGWLKELKIEKCEALKSIPLDYFPKVNELSLKGCGNFESFRFAEEPSLVLESLSFLKLEGLPKFVSFPEGGLPAPNLKDFRIEECENLRSLPQQMHKLLPSLNNLWVYKCGEIEWWPEGGLSNLEVLDIWRCKKLAAKVMHWDLQTLTPCLKELDIDGCGEELLDSFPPEGLLPTSLTSLSIHNFRRLKTLNIHASQIHNTLITRRQFRIEGYGEDLLDSFPPEELLPTSLTSLYIRGFPHLQTLNIHAFQHLKYLKQLGISSCNELQCLPEESLPNSLELLLIWSCPLLEQRYRKETGEGWHKISHIPTVVINGRKQH